jgi:tetratricopeptide (TPR) repeat protein
MRDFEHSRLLAFVAAAALTVGAARVEAQAPAAADPANDVNAARLHFTKGKRLFELQHYAEAAREYEAAYEAKDDPGLLFNVGQAYRLGGEYQKAIGAYKAFLRRNPQYKRTAELEARISELQQLVIQQKRTSEAPPNDVETPAKDETAQAPQPATTTNPQQAVTVNPAAPRDEIDPRAGRGKRLAGIGLMAGGGAALIAGGTLTGLAYQLQHAQSSPSPGTKFDPSAPSRLKTEQISGGVLLGVGAGAAVAGVVSYLIGRRDMHRTRVAAAPMLAPGLAAITVKGSF